MQFKHQYKKESNREKDEWRTPPEIFDPLNKVFGFTLDAAASADNSKCLRFMDSETNGLVRSWSGERVWINPPYTEGQYADWIAKGADEWLQAEVDSVLLVPASLETKAFNPAWQHASYLVLPYTRISFLLPNGSRAGGAPFASVLVVFGFRPRSVVDEIKRVTPLSEVGHVMPLYENSALGYRSKYR